MRKHKNLNFIFKVYICRNNHNKAANNVINILASKDTDKYVPVLLGLFTSSWDFNTNRPFYCCVLSYLAMNASEAGGDLALIQTSLLFSCKCKLVSIRTTWFAQQSNEVCIKTRSTPASLPFRGQVTKPTTVKWSIMKTCYVGLKHNIQQCLLNYIGWKFNSTFHTNDCWTSSREQVGASHVCEIVLYEWFILSICRQNACIMCVGRYD